MTGAERQARYRAAHGWRTGHSHSRPVDRRSRIQRWNDTIAGLWSCRSNTPTGWTRCRTTNRTVRSRRPCGRLSNSICPSSRRSSRHGASAVTEQRDGPTAWVTMTRGAGCRHRRSPPEPRVDAGMKELNEMTIGRTDDPENPFGAGFRSRLFVWDWIADPIWASGHDAASTGRTHDRNRPARQNSHFSLASEGPSTHARSEATRAISIAVRNGMKIASPAFAGVAMTGKSDATEYPDALARLPSACG